MIRRQNCHNHSGETAPMANNNTADAASKANAQIISTTENKKSIPMRKGGRYFRNASDGYRMAIAAKRGMKPMKNRISENECNHCDSQSTKIICHTKHSKNARNTLGRFGGNVSLESINARCRLMAQRPGTRDAMTATAPLPPGSLQRMISCCVLVDRFHGSCVFR